MISSSQQQALNTSGMRRYFEWYYNSRFALNITHTEVLLPADYEYEDDDEETAKENMSDGMIAYMNDGTYGYSIDSETVLNDIHSPKEIPYCY